MKQIRRHISTAKECSKKCSKKELDHINSICDTYLKLNKAKLNQKRSKSAVDIKVPSNDSDNQATSFINEKVNCDGCGKEFSIGRPIKGSVALL